MSTRLLAHVRGNAVAYLARASDVPAEPHVVDNAHYSYQLVRSPGACGSIHQLVGAAVHYALP